MTETSRRPAMDRAVTEDLLREAALTLLRRDGVLTGLNLREVADEAGVNRGLVYHYFGSRRDLLRSAIAKDSRARIAEAKGDTTTSPLRQILRAFRAVIRFREPVALQTLLVLDGEKRVRLMPMLEGSLELFRRDQEAGIIAADLDPEALLVLVNSFAYGYSIYRESMAREVGVAVTKLDDRVEELWGRLLSSVLPDDTADDS